MTPSRRAAWFRPDIDGLRAVAVVMVVGYHAQWPGFTAGLVGVDVFLVISGFVITAMLLRELEATGRVSWPAFFARRVRRLLPAAALMVAVVVALAGLVGSAWSDPWTVPLAGVAALTSTANLHYWWTWRDGMVAGEPTPLLHTWSLSMEEQFYLVLPLVAFATLWLARGLIARGRTTPRAALLVATVLLGAGSYAWTSAVSGDTAPGLLYLLPFRAFELCLGVAVALVGREVGSGRVRTVLGVSGLVLLATVMAVPDRLGAYPGHLVLLPCLGAVALVLARPSWLALPPLVYVGTLSYGWYLWHLPAIELARAWNLGPVPESTVTLLAIGSLVPAALSHHLLEQPIRRRQARAVPTLAAALSTVLVLSVASAGVGAQAASRPADFPRPPASCRLEPTDTVPRTGARCEVTHFDARRPTVVLRGDSQAWQLLPAVLGEARERDVNVVAWIYPDCPPLELTDEAAWRFLTTYERGSPGWNRWADCLVVNQMASLDLAGLRDGAGVATIAAAAWPAYRDGAEPRVLRMLDRATRGLAQEITTFVAPVPELAASGTSCSTRWWRVAACDVDRDVASAASGESARWLEASAGDARVVDLTDELCDDRSCRAEAEGTPVYVDPTHLDARWVERQAAYFTDVLDDLVGRADQ
ncbi:acyltransferase family protein [Nocardioides currus]|uniref:Acyltransferase n=1 Tax=Nocardioides currus TaxID=2133958 RepID=A0A2R7YYK9_9ACTN|nr:acyltransferase family protein [Nocardioides currus]PUA81468.1 hypothetical protein C7S10_05125 [Nocardioides currus]